MSSLMNEVDHLLGGDVLEEGLALHVIFRDNDPFEVVGSRKEAKENVNDYQSHRDNRGAKFDIRPYNKVASILKKTDPDKYKKLESQKALHNKLLREFNMNSRGEILQEEVEVDETLLEEGTMDGYESVMKSAVEHLEAFVKAVEVDMPKELQKVKQGGMVGAMKKHFELDKVKSILKKVKK